MSPHIVQGEWISNTFGSFFKTLDTFSVTLYTQKYLDTQFEDILFRKTNSLVGILQPCVDLGVECFSRQIHSNKD